MASLNVLAYPTVLKRPAEWMRSKIVTTVETQETEKIEKESALDAYCINLNKKAEAGRVDPLIGREAEVLRTIQVLCRRHKNNPLLIGDPGVGKTAIAEGLARKIINHEYQKYSLRLLSLLLIWVHY